MIQKEKIDAAVEILRELNIDMWLTFVRETPQTPDPVLPLITPLEYTWLTALIVTRTGRTVAIVGNHDEDANRLAGVFREVIGYERDFAEPLSQVLESVRPAVLALNYSLHDPASDGLSHGLHMYLSELLARIGFDGEIVSAVDIINRLRGRKTDSELGRIRTATETAESIFQASRSFIQAGVSEFDIAMFFQDQLYARGVEPAWLAEQCPAVMAGPNTALGHASPSRHQVVQKGYVITVDFGVRQHEYCSDLQRCYYVRHDGEQDAPEEVVRAFETLKEAVRRAAVVLRPGVTGEYVDMVARDYVTFQGYPEWTFGLGHQIGRLAHDGGTLLGPRWERYGAAVDMEVEAGNVFTLELGIRTSRGWLGLEEMVHVGGAETRFISARQKHVFLQ